MACTLAESPSDPFHRKLRQLCCLRCRFDCYRVERTSSRAGVAPAEVQRLFTAHFYVNYAAGCRSEPEHAHPDSSITTKLAARLCWSVRTVTVRWESQTSLRSQKCVCQG